MKKEELMIGDWVQDDEPDADGIIIRYKVEAEDFTNEAFMNGIEPIPITSEILFDNGFSKYNDGCYERHYTYVLLSEYTNLKLFALYDCDFSYNMNHEAWKIKYVHELQHVIHLCHIDKDIQLDIEVNYKNK